MASYLKLNSKKIDNIAERFNLQIDDVNPIKGGACNSSFRIISGDQEYILTVFYDHDRDYISRYCDILLHLNDNNFCTSKIIQLNSGGYVTEIDGKPSILKTFLEGSVQPNLSLDMVEQIGMKLAELHLIQGASFLPNEHAHGVNEFQKADGLGIDPEFEEWLMYQKKRFTSKISRDLPRGLIHGDLFFDNVLFVNGKVSAFIDFVESCNYYLVFDLGMALVGVCMEIGRINFEKASSLLTGYEKVRNLEDGERDALKIFAEYAATALSYWRFKRYHIQKEVPEKSEEHLIAVKIADMIRSIPDEEFKEYFRHNGRQ